MLDHHEIHEQQRWPPGVFEGISFLTGTLLIMESLVVLIQILVLLLSGLVVWEKVSRLMGWSQGTGFGSSIVSGVVGWLCAP